MSCHAQAVDQVPLDSFVPYVAMYCKGAPDDLIAHNVRLSAIEFCSRTMALERTLNIDLQKNVIDYCLDAEDDCVVIRSVSQLCVQGYPYRLLPEAPCVTCCGQIRDTAATNFFSRAGAGFGFGCGNCLRWRTYWIDENRDLLIWPPPDCDMPGAIELRAKTTPGQDCCFLPRFLYDNFAEVIADGATYRLLMMKGAPWYDTGMAAVFVKKHASGTGMAKTLAARKFNTGPTRLTPRRWA